MYNSINSKLKDVVYMPKPWVQPKLKQLKTTGSLDVATHITSDSVQVKDNVISMEIVSQEKTAILQLSFFQNGIIKCHCINPANPSLFSVEMVEKPENLTAVPVSQLVTLGSQQLEVNLPVDQMKVIVAYNPYNITVISTKDSLKQEVLCSMNSSKSLVFDQGICADFNFQTEYLYGLAEHAHSLLLEDTQKDRPYRFFNQDVCAYPVDSKNAVYGTIPIIVSRKAESQTYVSVYWQNAADTYIDIHKAKETSRTYWLSERGNLEFYIFANHSAASHYKALSNVLGHCAMPQYFSLGYHQSRYSYKDQNDVLMVNQKFTEHEIPCDSITLDIDHTDGCRYFTWNKELYPDPEAMQNTLVESKRQLVTICDPHIKLDEEYHVYAEGLEKDLFVKTKEGENFVGICWPKESVWFDYLNEEARASWASQYSYEKYKHSTPNLWAWNDMNEPSVFELPGLAMPLDNLHTCKTLENPEKSFQVEHREVHNLYGYCMHKGSYEGLVKRNACQNIRPHVLSRSFYAGSQKYAAIWTGDTRATWPYLKTTVPMLLSLSLCGISFCGGDVGGFIGDPEPELAVRWYQLGAFMPYFRGHSECNAKRREPWMYINKFAKPIKESIRDRYKLLPFWYTLFEEHTRTAVPIMRPIWFDQEKITDPTVLNEQERFMLGDALLVVPILESGKLAIENPLKGLEGRWYDYYHKREIVDDEKIRTGLERIGCFIKGGHIIPQFDIRSHTQSTQDAKLCNINLVVALDDNNEAKGKLYVDDGETFNYKKGACMRTNFEFKEDTLTWTGDENNGYEVPNRVTKVYITGLDTKYENAFLIQGATNKQKIQIVKGSGHLLLEFVALASKNWKIVLN